MSTKAVFTMKLEPELRDMFMAEAAADDRPAAQVVRELMRDYISRRREAREYDEFVGRKVQRARASMKEGKGISQEDIEADAAARRIPDVGSYWKNPRNARTDSARKLSAHLRSRELRRYCVDIGARSYRPPMATK